MPEKRPTRDIKGHQLGSPRERRGGRSSSSGKSLGFLVHFPSQVVPSSTQRAQIGGLWLLTAGLTGASTPGREGPKSSCLQGWTGPRKGLLAKWMLFCRRASIEPAGNIVSCLSPFVGNQGFSCIHKFPALYPQRTMCPGLLPSAVPPGSPH